MATAPVRRRRLGVLAAAALAFAGGAALGARGDDGGAPPRPVAVPGPAPAPARGPVHRASLERQVGQLVVLRFEGTRAPRYVRDILRRGWASGAILFRDNAGSPAQMRPLT